ncbi:MAG: 3'-5' exonuclease [Planctomycetes bacterium]|nr:3'-5' exonuclease [Planctomycetota bacterium]
MLLELQRPLVFLDFESTGLDTGNDRIVELAFVRLLPDGRRESLVRPVNPGVAAMSKGATKVTGIHTNDACGLFGDNGKKPAQPLRKLGPELIAFLGDSDIAGFNQIAYDIPLWLAECKRHGIAFDMKGRHQVDVKVLFNVCEKAWDRFLMGPRNLSAAVRHYCGREHEGAHSAEADTQATVDVLLAQLKRHPDLPRNVKDLADFCARNSDRERDDDAGRGRTGSALA